MSEHEGEWIARRPDGWEENPGVEQLDDEGIDSRDALRIGKRELMVGLGLVTVLGTLAAYGAAHNKRSITQNFKRRTPAPLAASCPQPSQKSINAVNRLFTEPYKNARAEYRKLPLDGYQKEGDLTLPNLFGTAGEELLYYTRPFFEKYDIDIQVASDVDKLPGYGMRAPTQEEFYSSNMSNNVLGIVGGLADVAPHYDLRSGLRRIVLVGGGKDTEFAWTEPHTLYWNITTAEENLDAVPFEFGIALGHFTEDRLCGTDGTENDRAFDSANGNLFMSAIPAQNSIYAAKGEASNSSSTLEGFRSGDARSQDVNVIDSRATEALSTDKAEILALIANPAEAASALSPDHPRLRAKAIVALAELYQQQPAVVRRLAVKADQYPYVGPNANNSPSGSRDDNTRYSK
jgi:hypothetical protein